MRVMGINAYNGFALQSKNNVNFGRFTDDNADRMARQLIPDFCGAYEILRDSEAVLISSVDGTLQGRKNEDYFKRPETQRYEKFFDRNLPSEELKNLGSERRLSHAASVVEGIKDLIKEAANPTPKPTAEELQRRAKEEAAQRKAKEAREEDPLYWGQRLGF